MMPYLLILIVEFLLKLRFQFLIVLHNSTYNLHDSHILTPWFYLISSPIPEFSFT